MPDETIAASPATRSGVRRRLLRYAVMIGLPFVLMPLLLPRKAHARRPAGSARGSRTRALGTGRLQDLQQLVDDYRARLGIPDRVVAGIVPENTLVVSVARAHGGDAAFALSIEEGFLATLTDDEIAAVVAHELGHVWIFTHHPFLQTEAGANDIALRLVSRDALTGVYDKVWRRAGAKGALTYLPAR